jgi:hypothetical protein
MMRIIGGAIAIAVGLLMRVNAAFMLVSPRRWFRLPSWLKLQGSLIENRYTTVWGAIQLRLTGTLILATIGWVIYDLFFSRTCETGCGKVKNITGANGKHS